MITSDVSNELFEPEVNLTNKPWFNVGADIPIGKDDVKLFKSAEELYKCISTNKETIERWLVDVSCGTEITLSGRARDHISIVDYSDWFYLTDIQEHNITILQY